MGFFDFLKNDNSSKKTCVWRNSAGSIECPGDSCPKECDTTCPIWCQTMAIQAMQSGDSTNAIALFRKALEIAPDYKEAWNNLAAVYGGMNNHLEANKAYKAAYMLDKNYKNALYGMIVSFKNLGQLDEAMSHIAEFEGKFGKEQIAKVKSDVLKLKDLGNVPRQETAVEMATQIIAKAREDSLLGENSNMPYIPEIMGPAKDVCLKIIKDLQKEPNGNSPDLWLAWGAYAGMGAVYHWHYDWESLKIKGIAETLLEPRGSFAMDEYVVDSIGIGFDTPEGKEFTQKVYNLGMWAVGKFIMDKPSEMLAQSAFEAMQSMYIFGMVLEMEKLGMK